MRDDQHRPHPLERRQAALQRHHQQRGHQAPADDAADRCRRPRRSAAPAPSPAGSARPTPSPAAPGAAKISDSHIPMRVTRRTCASSPEAAAAATTGDDRPGEPRAHDEEHEEVGRAQHQRRQRLDVVPAQHHRVGDLHGKLRQVAADQRQPQAQQRPGMRPPTRGRRRRGGGLDHAAALRPARPRDKPPSPPARMRQATRPRPNVTAVGTAPDGQTPWLSGPRP